MAISYGQLLLSTLLHAIRREYLIETRRARKSTRGIQPFTGWDDARHTTCYSLQYNLTTNQYINNNECRSTKTQQQRAANHTAQRMIAHSSFRPIAARAKSAERIGYGRARYKHREKGVESTKGSKTHVMYMQRTATTKPRSHPPATYTEILFTHK